MRVSETMKSSVLFYCCCLLHNVTLTDCFPADLQPVSKPSNREFIHSIQMNISTSKSETCRNMCACHRNNPIQMNRTNFHSTACESTLIVSSSLVSHCWWIYEIIIFSSLHLYKAGSYIWSQFIKPCKYSFRRQQRLPLFSASLFSFIRPLSCYDTIITIIYFDLYWQCKNAYIELLGFNKKHNVDALLPEDRWVHFKLAWRSLRQASRALSYKYEVLFSGW